MAGTGRVGLGWLLKLKSSGHLRVMCPCRYRQVCSVSRLVTGVTVRCPVEATVVMLVTYHVSKRQAYLKVTSAWHQLTQTHQLLSQLVVFIDIPLSVCLSGSVSV